MNLHNLIRNHLLKRSCLSILLYPLGFVYAKLQASRRKHLVPRTWNSPCKVISIGNLTAGGSGKTPLTIALARMLQEAGYAVAVSHRGYKGEYERIPTLISNQDKVLYPPEIAGDEAHLIASSLPGIPVVVGKNRRVAIRLLLRLFPSTQIVIMDDAMQHLRVHRDLDIVSFSAEIGLGNGWVIPAGYLRESLEAITEPCLVMIYSKLPGIDRGDWARQLAAKTSRIYHSHARIAGWKDADGNIHRLEELQGKSIALVSGIADPASFEGLVKGHGIEFRKHYQYPDHYYYADTKCLQDLRLEPAEVLLCTEKDLGKLARHEGLQPRLAAIILDYVLDDATGFLNEVLNAISI